MKAKILTVARFNLLLKGCREKPLKIVKRATSFDGMIPMEPIYEAKEPIKSDVNHFLTLKKIDSVNEKFPH